MRPVKRTRDGSYKSSVDVVYNREQVVCGAAVLLAHGAKVSKYSVSVPLLDLRDRYGPDFGFHTPSWADEFAVSQRDIVLAQEAVGQIWGWK